MLPPKHSMKIAVIFMVFNIYSASLLAQSFAKPPPATLRIERNDTQKEILPLSIGDQVPDFIFENILNYKKKKAKLSDFTGKLVILDMWSIYCTSCIAAFPKMEELQREFDSKIQILLANPHDPKYDSEEKIKTILERWKIRTGYYTELPIPIHDSILNLFFPHQSVPHQVWIDSSGKLVGITGSNEVTSENIQAVLEGKFLNLPVKNDWAFDTQKPLLADGNGGDPNNFLYRSVLTGYNGGIGFAMGIRRNANKQITGFYVLNYSLRQLIGIAYSDIINDFPESRIILDVADTAKYSNEFSVSNTFCYDLTLPANPSRSPDLKKYLQEDLARLLNISVRVVRRKLNSYILTASDSLLNSRTKYAKSELDLDEGSINKYLRNYTVDQTVKFLESSLDRPLFNEVAMKISIDINFPSYFSLRDKDRLLQKLTDIGFKVREEVREMDVIVISDK